MIANRNVKYTKERISLVIQGPLISKGKTGLSNIYDNNTEDHVEYNCVNNINRIVKEYKNLFESIILVTWKDQLELCQNIEDVYIIGLDDINPNLKLRNNKPNSINKFRQFYSSEKGVEFIEKNIGSTYSIKIRTDQFIELDKLVGFINSLSKQSNLIRVYMPYFRKDKKFWIPDFYFLGKTHELLEFFKALNAFEFAEFSEAAPREVFFKYAYSFNYEKLSLPIFLYFQKGLSEYYSGIEKIEFFMYSEILSPLPKDAYISLEWRGEHISSEKISFAEKRFVFVEEWDSQEKTKILQTIPSGELLPKVSLFNAGYFINVDLLLKYHYPFLKKINLFSSSLFLLIELYSYITRGYMKLKKHGLDKGN